MTPQAEQTNNPHDDAAKMPHAIKEHLQRLIAAAESSVLTGDESLNLKNDLYDVAQLVGDAIAAANKSAEIAGRRETRPYNYGKKKAA